MSEKKSISNLFKLYFFLIFGALGTLITYIPLHFKRLNFSGSQISLIQVLGSFALIVIAPKYGLLFDNAANKRNVLIISLLIMICSLGTIGYFQAFLPILLLWVIYRTVTGPLYSISENLSYGVMTHQNSTFGAIRLWGSVGYALATLAGGWTYQNFGLKANNLTFFVLMGLSVIVLLLMPAKAFEIEKDPLEKELNLVGVFKLILRNRFLLLMALALAISDPTQDGVRSFEPIFLENLGLQASMIGLANMLSALTEVPFMIYADRVIQKIGIRQIILFVFIFDIARRLAVWLFPFTGVVFATSVMTSLSFTFRLVCSIMLINLCLPKQVTSAANAFVGVTLFSLGYMLSNALGGMIYDTWGNQPIYLMGAAFSLISLILALFAGELAVAPKSKVQNQAP